MEVEAQVIGLCRRPLGPTAKRRAAKNRRLKKDEAANKAEVRARDSIWSSEFFTTGRCRFPMCGCGMTRDGFWWVEVSHFAQHKGMGGDPTGDRSSPDKLICVCNWRHKEARYSIDKGSVRCVPLTTDGSNGPVAWEVKFDGYGWIEVARETAVQVLAPISTVQSAILTNLAEMRT
jgi:hypothetical protein